MRNGFLWSNVVFKREVIFHEFDFETSDLEFEVSKWSIWKHTTLCDKGVFSSIILSQLWRAIELKFSQVCYFVQMLRYTKWEDWSWQLPILFSVFNTGWKLPKTDLHLVEFWARAVPLSLWRKTQHFSF